MTNKLAIRREDKNKWERRVPLTPAHVSELVAQHNLKIMVQSSPIRAFVDDDYAQFGASIHEDISAADVVLAVKEIPIELIQPHKTYVFFSHTIKGQPYNMPLLRRLMELKCQLIDYERIVDDQNRRLVFFGRHAGLAGMIDTLHALGQRLAWEGLETPLADIKPTYEYGNLSAAKEAVRRVGQKILEDGLPVNLLPFVIGVAGYGRVSGGAQEILDLLPIRPISPAELLTLADEDNLPRNLLYKVVFREEDTVEPVEPDTPFKLPEFFNHPERYQSKFAQYLPHLTGLVNCIYWDTPYPRLLTKEQGRDMYQAERRPRLRVIGDISCDIEGGIEPTVKATSPDEPVFVWDPATDRALDGVAGSGPVIMAVDNLPCELPIESSTHFGDGLLALIPALAECDFSLDFETCSLPPALKRGTIVYHGELTPDYQYLQGSV